MKEAIRQLDQRFSVFRALKDATRPSKGWIRAVRDALGMTTAQCAKRMGVSQPRVVAIEKAEVSKAITLKTLERAAEAVGCRIVYLFVPDRPLEETMRARALCLADRMLSSVEQSMRLEAQSISTKGRNEKVRNLAEELMSSPSRLWVEDGREFAAND